MKPLFLILVAVFALQSCETKDKNYMIYNKSVILENPNFSNYSYRRRNITTLEMVQFIDSTNKYNLGDIVIK